MITIALAPGRLCAGDPGGETTPTDRARRLFSEGLVEADAGRWAEAADSFSRAYALRPSPPIAYNLATALERRGQLVRASQLLTSITDDPEARPAVREAARDRLVQVVPRLARVTVQASPAERPHLWLDGRPLDPAAAGAPTAVDPGEHVIEVRRDSAVVLSRRLALGEGDERTVVMELAAPVVARAPAIAVASPPAEPPRRPLLRSPWLWGAVGAAVLGSAAVFLAARGGGAEPARGNVGTWDLPR